MCEWDEKCGIKSVAYKVPEQNYFVVICGLKYRAGCDLETRDIVDLFFYFVIRRSRRNIESLIKSGPEIYVVLFHYQMRKTFCSMTFGFEP